MIDPSGLHNASPQQGEWTTADFFYWYYIGLGGPIDLANVGLLDDLIADLADDVKLNAAKESLASSASVSCDHPSGSFSGTRRLGDMHVGSGRVTDPLTVIAGTTIYMSFSCTVDVTCECCGDKETIVRSQGNCNTTYTLKDRFANPCDWVSKYYERDEEAYKNCKEDCLAQYAYGYTRGDYRIYNSCLETCDALHPRSEWPGATPYDMTATWSEHYGWVKDFPCK